MGTRACNTKACPIEVRKVDCSWGAWSTWGACSKCGGERTRFRHVVREPSNGGKSCDAGSSEEMDKCPRRCHEKSYCVWGEWGPFSECTETCGTGGKRSRQRSLVLKRESELKELHMLYEEKASSQPSNGPWLLSQGLRMEILLAFVCGYFGRMIILVGSRAWTRTWTHRERNGRVLHTPREGTPGSGANSLLVSGFFGSSSAFGLGYQSLPQMPMISELEA